MATTEQLGCSETTDFLQGVADRKQQVLPLLRAVILAFQYALCLRQTLPSLLIEAVDLSGDIMARGASGLCVTRF